MQPELIVVEVATLNEVIEEESAVSVRLGRRTDNKEERVE
jgi:hypothetical protein